MDILLYASLENQHKDTLIKNIAQACKLMPFMVFDLKSLFESMKLKRSGQLIIFLISSHKELEVMDSNRTCLSNKQNIIILPSHEDTLVSMALSLYPRYLSYSNSNFEDVCAVLNKMIENTDKKNSHHYKGER